MIGIVDYGLGNLANVKNACETLGYAAFIASDAAQLQQAHALILPGVGAFEAGMKGLAAHKLDGFLKEWARDNKGLLGICLGMQLLFEKSYENGCFTGLGLIGGEVVAIEGDVKVPHMGYNQLHILQPKDPLMHSIQEGAYVYFVHSYHAKTEQKYIVATTDYADAGDLCSIVRCNSVCATQFHPEKSAATGLQILKNYLESQE
jgi:glutamine amidotransferase